MPRHRILLLVAALALPALAVAGERIAIEVVVGSAGMWGSFGGARASADATQYISCWVNATETSLGVGCAGKDADGRTGSCTSRDPEFIETISSMDDDVYVQLLWDDTRTCTRLSSAYGSSFTEGP